jgi:hypothetical protein
VFTLLRSEIEVDVITLPVLALAAGLFVFTFVLLAYGLYLLFGQLVVFAAAAGVVAGLLVYLVDTLTTPKAPK